MTSDKKHSNHPDKEPLMEEPSKDYNNRVKLKKTVSSQQGEKSSDSESSEPIHAKKKSKQRAPNPPDRVSEFPALTVQGMPKQKESICDPESVEQTKTRRNLPKNG